MSNVFEHYEADYHSSTRTAAQNIEKLPDLLPGHEKAELTAATDRAIDAAEDIVKQMELEARSLQGEERQLAVAQAKDYKASITALKEQLKALRGGGREAQEDQCADLVRGRGDAPRQRHHHHHQPGQRALQKAGRCGRGTNQVARGPHT